MFGELIINEMKVRLTTSEVCDTNVKGWSHNFVYYTINNTV